MTDIHECPVDGCEYTGVKSSVQAHYSGKQDEQHAGGYERARMIIDGQAEPADPTPSDTDETPSEPDTPDTSDSPVHDHPPVESGQSGGTNAACPHCGDSLGVTEAQARELIDQGKDTCGNCGKTIDYESE